MQDAVVPFEQLQQLLQELFAASTDVHDRLAAQQATLESINIYRPLKAYRQLRRMRPQSDAARLEASRIVNGLSAAVMLTPDHTMGEALASCLDTLRISNEVSRLQAEATELGSAIEQTGAFAFAVFALYVALISLTATVCLGVLPLII